MKKYFQQLVLAVSLCFLLPQPSHATGNDNPTGVTGEYNGSLDTGLDPYTGNGKRFITDLTVTGSLGAYPLKWTRVLNTRYGGGPNHSYNWGLWLRQYRPYQYFPDPYTGPGGSVTYPDGRKMDLDVDETNTYYPASGPEPADRLEPVGGGNYDLILADGGRVEFRVDSPPPPETYYTLTATRIIDPHGLVTLLERDGSHRLKKITEPGGRYLEITYHTYYDWVPWPAPGGTQASTVISKVEAFARPGQLIEQVDYIYAEEYVQGFTYRKLAHVNYADGAQASYTYFPPAIMAPPFTTPVPSYAGRMKTLDDPRVPGPMGKIEYDYLTVAENYNRPVGGGQVQRVKYPGSSTYISEVIYPEDIPYSAEPAEFVRTERRPNGTTRSFQYSNTGTPELESYTDFKGQRSYINWPYIPGSTTYRRSLTNARGKTSSIDKEYWVGAVKKKTNADGNSVSFAYTDETNPHYLLSKTDQRGKITSYTRYPANHPNRHMIQRIDYPDNGWESFVYNNFGQVIEHRMTSGGTEYFTYDTRGLKQTYTPPITSSDGAPGAHPTVYTYYYGNEENRPDRADRLKSVTDPLGHTTTYDYNKRGQVTTVKHHDLTYTESHYNHDGTLAWSEDELRHRTSYRYDEFKRVIEVKNHLSQYTTNSYDPDPGPADLSLSHTTSSVYRTTSFMGKVTEYKYDENFRRIATIQAPGTGDEATTTSTYDPAGNLETVTQPNAQPGQPHAPTHSLTQYDDCNRRKSVTDALTHTIEWEYDDADNMEKETRPDLKFRTWDLYDGMNRIKQTTGFLNDRTTYDYDFAGNLRVMTDSKGAQYVSVYDELNRKISATYPVDANNQIRTETWLYDIAGNLKVYKNPAGKFKHFQYDVRNRLRRAYWSDVAESGSPNQGVGPDIETTLDEASRVTEIRTNGNQTIVAFGYDEANRKIWQDQTVGGFTRRVETNPDLDGNRATLSVAGVFALTYDYTQRQQLWHIKTGGNQFFEYGYDRNGNLRKRHNQFQGADSTNFEYDALNRVTRGEQFQKNGVSFAQSNYNDYDLLNNLQSISRVEDGNKGERFEYDDASQLKKASYNVAIGPPPPPTPPPTPPPAQTPTPPPTPPPGQSPTPPPGPGTPTPPPPTPPPTATPPPGQVAQVELWNTDDFGETWYVTMTTGTSGATIFYKIGQNGYINPTHNGGQATNGTSVYTGAPIPVPVGSTCHFRAVAYREGMIDSVMTDLSVDNVENGGNSAASGPRTVTYINDPLNRTSMNNNGTVTVYGPPSGVNQYTSVTGHTLTYDANFNLSGYDAWSYVYDAEKRLISASGSGTAMGQGHSAQFVYDGLGRCVKRTIDNVTTLITYDEWKPVAEWNGAGGLVAWNLYGPGPDEVLVRYDASAASYRYYHLDAHGHVRFLLDGNGEVIEKYSYDAFGHPKIMDRTGTERTATSYGNRFLFTGREYLSAFGIYDYRQRVYHPEQGRFLQVDPIGFKGDAANLYRYCHNDPVNKSDPTGLTDVNYVGDDLKSYMDDLNPKDVISVSAHGTPRNLLNNFWGGKGKIDLPVKQVAQDVRGLDKFKNNKDMAIRLYSCRAGDWKTAALHRDVSAAQKLATETDRHVQATGADINPKTGTTWKTPVCNDQSWYDFSPDGSEPKRIPDPSGIRRGGLYSNDGLGGTESRSDTRPTFDAYGSTTEAAAAWEASSGLGGWLGTQRNLGR